MNVALNVEENTKTLGDMDSEEEAHFEKMVRALCGLFVTLLTKSYFLSIRLPEYLLLDQANRSQWKHSFDLNDFHVILAKRCIICLWFRKWELNVSPDIDDFEAERCLD